MLYECHVVNLFLHAIPNLPRLWAVIATLRVDRP